MRNRFLMSQRSCSELCLNPWSPIKKWVGLFLGQTKIALWMLLVAQIRSCRPAERHRSIPTIQRLGHFGGHHCFMSINHLSHYSNHEQLCASPSSGSLASLPPLLRGAVLSPLAVGAEALLPRLVAHALVRPAALRHAAVPKAPQAKDRHSDFTAVADLWTKIVVANAGLVDNPMEWWIHIVDDLGVCLYLASYSREWVLQILNARHFRTEIQKRGWHQANRSFQSRFFATDSRERILRFRVCPWAQVSMVEARGWS